jgi:glycosyltransferase involved in cell wall biosynthesis
LKYKILNFRYIYKPEKKNIGAKRNTLNQEAKGDIIVAMDDDDFYFPGEPMLQ